MQPWSQPAFGRRRWLSPLLALALVGGALVAPATARAASATDWIDPEAPVIVRLDPRSIAPATRLLARASSRLAGLAQLASILARTAVEIDPLTTRGLAAAGIAIDQPIWLSLAAIEADAARARYAKVRAQAALVDGPPIFWRSRAVIPLADPARADALVRRIAALYPGLEGVSPAAFAVDALVGAELADHAAVIAALSGAGVIAAGRISGSGGLVAVARHDSLLVIDILVPFAKSTVAWPRDGQKLLALISRRPGQARMPPAPPRGGDLFIHVDGGRAMTAARLAAADTRIDRGQAKGALGMGDLPDLEVACAGATAIAERGALSAVSASLSVRADGFAGELRWALRRSGIKRVLAPRAPVAGWMPNARRQVLAATLGLAPGKLGGLWFPPALAQTRDAFWRSVSDCGPVAHGLVVMLGWPEIAAAFGAEVSELGEGAAAMVASLAGLRIAAREVALDSLSMRGAVEIVARREQAAAIRRLLDLVFGPSIRDDEGRRLWTGGPLVPFEDGGDRRWAVFGAALGDGAVNWYLGGAPQRVPRDLFAAARLDVDAAVRQLAGDVPELAAWLDNLGRRDAAARAELGVGGRAIVARIELSVR